MPCTGLRMFCVDSDVPSRIMLRSMFEDQFDVELFDSAESCLSRLAEASPDLMLLDVGLPGMDGFELCRRFKAEAATAHVPVIFIARDEGLENRLQGYDAGGEDFILKPYSVEEVRRKVATVRLALEGAATLRRQLDDSDQLGSLLMANMDEYAVLIKFMRLLNECVDEEGIAAALLTALRGFRLEGVVQVRLGGEEFTLSEEGRDRSLETSVLNHVRGLERIFEFRQRCVFNFDSLTVLVKNMPIQDPETCGRLRDHLAIAAEIADAKLQAILLSNRNGLTQRGIRELLAEIHLTIDAHVQRSREARRQEALRTSEMLDQLTIALAHLGMTGEQEDEIERLVVEKARGLVTIYDNGDDSTATLRALGQRLETMLH